VNFAIICVQVVLLGFSASEHICTETMPYGVMGQVSPSHNYHGCNDELDVKESFSVRDKLGATFNKAVAIKCFNNVFTLYFSVYDKTLRFEVFHQWVKERANRQGIVDDFS